MKKQNKLIIGVLALVVVGVLLFSTGFVDNIFSVALKDTNVTRGVAVTPISIEKGNYKFTLTSYTTDDTTIDKGTADFTYSYTLYDRAVIRVDGDACPYGIGVNLVKEETTTKNKIYFGESIFSDYVYTNTQTGTVGLASENPPTGRSVIRSPYATERTYYNVPNGNYETIITIRCQITPRYIPNDKGGFTVAGRTFETIGTIRTGVITEVFGVSLKTLTPADQAQVIKDLTSQTEAQAKLIAELNLTFEEQAKIITALTNKADEQAILVRELTSTVDGQAKLIAEMKLTVEENAKLISKLSSEIQIQAQIINQLTKNLEEKAYYVSQLQVENENQARLIKEMEVSFANQIEIIKKMKNTIEEDNSLINALKLSNEEQAKILKALSKNNEELAQRVILLGRSNEEMARLIDELQLNNKDLIELTANLQNKNQEAEKIIQELKSLNEKQKELLTKDMYARVQELEKQLSISYIIIGALIVSLLGLIIYVRRKK